MANYDQNPNEGVVDKRRLGRITTATNASNLAEVANVTGIGVMRTRLTALDAAYFTAARLDQMSENDMVFAIRQRTGDLAGI